MKISIKKAETRCFQAYILFFITVLIIALYEKRGVWGIPSFVRSLIPLIFLFSIFTLFYLRGLQIIQKVPPSNDLYKIFHYIGVIPDFENKQFMRIEKKDIKNITKKESVLCICIVGILAWSQVTSIDHVLLTHLLFAIYTFFLMIISWILTTYTFIFLQNRNILVIGD